ncbi:unnamed protein product, partial [Brassica oleracea var. botrytis]
ERVLGVFGLQKEVVYGLGLKPLCRLPACPPLVTASPLSARSSFLRETHRVLSGAVLRLFFGVLFLFRFESVSSLVLRNGLCRDSPIRVGHSGRTCLHVIEPIIPVLDP